MENNDTIKDIVTDAVGSIETDSKDAEKAVADAELDRKINEVAVELAEAAEAEKGDENVDVDDETNDVKRAVSQAVADVTKSEESEASEDMTLETLINDYNASINEIGTLKERLAEVEEENSKLKADNKIALARLAQGFRESQAVPASSLKSESENFEDVVDNTVKEILDQI